jgi:uncharacterized protein YutE (UPF0331/DUF86 family)
VSESTFDTAVVQERLRLMRDLLDDLGQVGEPSADDLARQRILRHAVERIITQLVDLAVSINSHLAAAEIGRGPATYRESFALAAQAGALPRELADRLAPSAGLRNILTHEYVAVDLTIVASSIPLMRAGYQEYIKAMARHVAGRAR